MLQEFEGERSAPGRGGAADLAQLAPGKASREQLAHAGCFRFARGWESESEARGGEASKRKKAGGCIAGKGVFGGVVRKVGSWCVFIARSVEAFARGEVDGEGLPEERYAGLQLG